MVSALEREAVSRAAGRVPGRAVRDAEGVPLYRLSYSIPVLATSAEFAAVNRIREQAADLLALRASEALSIPIEQIVIRDILPETDLGLSNEVWLTAALTANDYAGYIDQQLPTTKMLAIFSLVDITPNPIVTGARFQSGSARTLAEVQFEAAYGFSQSPEALIRPTLIWAPNETVNIDLYATAVTVQTVILNGFIAEAAGIQVSPPDYRSE